MKLIALSASFSLIACEGQFTLDEVDDIIHGCATAADFGNSTEVGNDSNNGLTDADSPMGVSNESEGTTKKGMQDGDGNIALGEGNESEGIAKNERQDGDGNESLSEGNESEGITKNGMQDGDGSGSSNEGDESQSLAENESQDTEFSESGDVSDQDSSQEKLTSGEGDSENGQGGLIVASDCI